MPDLSFSARVAQQLAQLDRGFRRLPEKSRTRIAEAVARAFSDVEQFTRITRWEGVSMVQPSEAGLRALGASPQPETR